MSLKEVVQEEYEEESDDEDMGFSLFGDDDYYPSARSSSVSSAARKQVATKGVQRKREEILPKVEEEDEEVEMFSLFEDDLGPSKASQPSKPIQAAKLIDVKVDKKQMSKTKYEEKKKKEKKRSANEQAIHVVKKALNSGTGGYILTGGWLHKKNIYICRYMYIEGSRCRWIIREREKSPDV
tara:strand:- start:647 stop:1192 length:546 start_codon:yes stop_codon:yes gene_type:complete